MKNIDVTALGELLIDFTENENKLRMPVFTANPGGAPCNVLAMLSKLGYRVSFIGKVGNDMFGNMLETKGIEAGINMTALVKSDEYQTTLAFVHKLDNGDRDFSFYRKNGADAMLFKQDINENLITESKVFHFGTLSMTEDIGMETTLYAVEKAKKSGNLISFDPNFRESLWISKDKAVAAMREGLQRCDVLKISDNEIELLTGETDYEKGARIIKEEYGIPLVFATLGINGSIAIYKDCVVYEAAFVNKDTIETTGAGDTFCACVLGKLLVRQVDKWDKNKILDGISDDYLHDMLRYANAAASIITTRRGALMVMPTMEEIDSFMNRETNGQKN